MLLRRYHEAEVQQVETPAETVVVKEEVKKKEAGEKVERKNNRKTASARV